MNVKEKTYAILKNLSCMETVKDDDHLQTELGLDSLSMVALLVKLEEELHIQLNESDMNPYDLLIVSDVVRLAEKYKGGENE